MESILQQLQGIVFCLVKSHLNKNAQNNMITLVRHPFHTIIFSIASLRFFPFSHDKFAFAAAASASNA
jgi:hypothetical protein